MRRAVALLLVVALVLGVLIAALELLRGDPGATRSGGGSARTAPPSPRPSEPTPSPDARLARYEGQRLDWQPCASQRRFDCARLRVPLDYTRPAGRTITLALLRVEATDPDERVGTLVVNPGGPGAPGTEYAAAGSRVFGRDLLAHFDIVGLDPRGTRGSEPVDCLDDDDLDAYLAADPDPATPAEAQALIERVETFNRGCVTGSGPIAAHASTVETARDLDVLRAVLREPRLDFLGASYGTDLGATYAQLFPERVGRMVLDGAVDISLTRDQANLQAAAGFQTALEAYLRHCVDQDSGCFLGDTVAAAQARLQRFLAETDRQPLEATDGRELTGGLALYGVLFALYSRDYWNVLSVGLRQAFDGDGSTLLTLADALNGRGPDGYVNNIQEAIVTINCLDDPAAATVAQVRAALPAYERASPVFGPALAWSNVICDGFTPRASEPPPDNRAEGAAPLLVIGTTRDPATPYAGAVALARRLSSAVLVTRDGDGHTGYHADNACVDRTVEDYLIDGTVPDAPVTC